MTNELETKIVSWLETSAQAIGDFASKEIPPFINEYLQWKFFEACFDSLTPFIGLFFGVFLLRWACKRLKIADPEGPEGGYEIAAVAIGVFTTAISTILFIFCGLSDIKSAVQIKLAPKVYLMEKAAEIIKNNSK